MGALDMLNLMQMAGQQGQKIGTPGINPNAPDPRPNAQPSKLDSFIGSPGGGFLMNLLAQSGYSPVPHSPFGAIGRAALLSQQQGQQRQRAGLENELLRARIGLSNRTPGTAESPSAVREFKFFEGLSEEEKRRYLAVKRAQQLENVPGAGLGSVNPLTNELENITPESTIVGGIGTRAGAAESGKQGAITAAIPGQAAARNMAEAGFNLPSDLAALDSIITKTDVTIEKIKEAKALAVDENVGLESRLRGDLPGFLGGGPRKLKQAVKSLQAEFGFDTLQKMRAASKTGGALGQVSERELDLLINALRSIDIEGDPETLQGNFDKVIEHYENYKNEMRIMQNNLRSQAGQTIDKPLSEMTDAELEAIANGNQR